MVENNLKDTVFQLLGKSVFLCQQIEHNFKILQARSTISINKTGDTTHIDKINSKLNSKCTMGNLGREYLNEVYSTPPANNGFIQMTYRRDGDQDIREKQFTEVVEIRNSIVHKFSQEFDLNTEDSRKNAVDYLKNKYEILQNEFDRLQSEREFCKDAIDTVSSFLMNPQNILLQYIVQIHQNFKDNEGWTSLVQAGRKLKEFSKADYEVISGIYRKKGLYDYIQNQECFETKKIGNICMYRITPRCCE